MSSAGLISISTYFLLNLVVTVTNKQLLFHTSSPFLLTASHAFTTFVATSIISRLTSATTPSHGSSQTQQTTTTHLILVAFSLLYTVNIALSNLTLGLVSLPMHQTIRATAPAITVLLTVIVSHTPLRYYPMAVYLSLVPTICGVVVATSSMSANVNVNVNVGHDTGRGSTTFGMALTFLGAVLAVVKTMITHQLQKSSSSSSSAGGYRLQIGLPTMTLVRYLSPYAVVQALGFACWTGEVRHLLALGHATDPAPRGLREIGVLAVVNMLSASALNIASFEANRRCGALSMGVAGNLKQVCILVLASLAEGDGDTGRGGGVNGRVVVGTLMTVVGGLWYAWGGAGAGAGMKARTHNERHGRGWGEADDDEQQEGVDRR
ncbi:hypothetical protein LTS15_009921 [Exophiala xenobiotica]|nr:hypothetical protein LTS15_009921 [Exophiala xenobiotica]